MNGSTGYIRKETNEQAGPWKQEPLGWSHRAQSEWARRGEVHRPWRRSESSGRQWGGNEELPELDVKNGNSGENTLEIPSKVPAGMTCSLDPPYSSRRGRDSSERFLAV